MFSDGFKQALKILSKTVLSQSDSGQVVLSSGKHFFKIELNFEPSEIWFKFDSYPCTPNCCFECDSIEFCVEDNFIIVKGNIFSKKREIIWIALG